MKSILCLGDSNSSTLHGKSWPDFLTSNLECSLLRASSCGAGNAFYIEKLHSGLKEFSPDLVVIQLTEPSRIVTGFEFSEEFEENGYDATNVFDDVKCYTWNSHNNESNIKRITSEKVNIDRIWTRYIALSNWTNYKIMQDILTMQMLCDKFNTRVIFWSWFVPFGKLFIEQYKWLQSDINYIDSCATDYLVRNKLSTISKDDYHYGPLEHSILVDKWLIPKLKVITKLY